MKAVYNKKQLDNNFIKNILPAIKERFEKDGIKDIPARCEAYNNLVDEYQKGGFITEKKANVYCIPKRLI